MSGHYYRVGVHGPPNPDEHSWVMVKWDGNWWRPVDVAAAPGRRWKADECWFPIEAPPSELAPEPEDQGVEVSGFRYRINADGFLQKHTQFGWVLSEYREVLADELAYLARIAAALGLVDQPPVPRALVTELQRWISDRFCDPNVRYAATTLLGRIKAGEFGPVEGER